MKKFPLFTKNLRDQLKFGDQVGKKYFPFIKSNFYHISKNGKKKIIKK